MEEGLQAIFTCLGHGTNLTVQWMTDGGKELFTERLGNLAILRFQSVAKSDTSFYVCRIRSSTGAEKTTTVKLLVEGMHVSCIIYFVFFSSAILAIYIMFCRFIT